MSVLTKKKEKFNFFSLSTSLSCRLRFNGFDHHDLELVLSRNSKKTFSKFKDFSESFFSVPFNNLILFCSRNYWHLFFFKQNQSKKKQLTLITPSHYLHAMQSPKR
jgi:hypothetical protein